MQLQLTKVCPTYYVPTEYFFLFLFGCASLLPSAMWNREWVMVRFASAKRSVLRLKSKTNKIKNKTSARAGWRWLPMPIHAYRPSDKTYYVARTKDNESYDKHPKNNIIADDAILSNTYLFYLY